MRMFAFALLPLALMAQAPPEPRALLARAAAPLFTAKTVRLAASQSQGFAGQASTPTGSFRMEFIRGGRGRAEFHSPFGNALLTLRIFDGAGLWEYHAPEKLYTKKSAREWTFDGEIATLDFGRQLNNIAAASYEPDETLDFNGRPVPCYVVRAEYRRAPKVALGPVVRRVWISKDSELILRDYWEGPLTFINTRQTETTNYTTIETGIPLSDDLFVFQPPPGSKEGELPVVGGLLGSPAPAKPAAPPPPVRPDSSPRVPVPASVQQAKLLRQPRPVYPPAAKADHIQGTVRLSAIISTEGTVQDLTLISGNQLLAPAAIDAVKQWKYQPTLRNGEPVEVATEIVVTFTLAQ